MAQQTASEWSRTAVRREKKTGVRRDFFAAAQKRFGKTLCWGRAFQALGVMAALFVLACAQLPGGLYPMAAAAFTACLLHAFSVPAAFFGCALAVAGGFSMANYWHWWQISACAAIWLMIPCWRRREGVLYWAMLACAIACAVPSLLLGAHSALQAMVGLANAASAMALVPVFERTLLVARDARRLQGADDVLCVLLTSCGLIVGLWTLGAIGRCVCRFAAALCIASMAHEKQDEGKTLLTAGVWGGVMTLCGGSVELAGVFAGAVLSSLPGIPTGKYNAAFFVIGTAIGALAVCESGMQLLSVIPLAAGGASAALMGKRLGGKLHLLCTGETAQTLMQSSAAAVRTAVTLRMWAGYMKGIAAALPEMSGEAQEMLQAEELAMCLCESCERKRECWTERFELTRKYMFKLLEAADTAEPAAVMEQAKMLGCVNIAKLEPILRMRRAQNAMEREEEARCRERRTLSAIQIEGTAQVLEGLSERFFARVQPDDAAYRRAQDELTRREVEAKMLYAVEVKGRKEIMMIRTGNATAEEMRRVADIACGVPMQPGAYETLTQTEVLFEQAARLEVDFSAVCRKKDGESVAGDGYIARPLSGGRYLLALSDGMGSGEAAHRESQATLHLLWQCLCAGYTRSQALLAVNGLLLSCAGSEMFATMDLCLIDLHTGEAAFEKLGACTSYVVRDGECRLLCADTLPMGVLTRVEPRSLRMHLMEGDLLVMVSDGIADGYPDGESGLRRALVKHRDENPRAICDAVIARTIKACGGHAGDDMTVICARIENSHGGW